MSQLNNEQKKKWNYKKKLTAATAKLHRKTLFYCMLAHQGVNPFAKCCTTAVDSLRIHPAQFIAFLTCLHPIIWRAHHLLLRCVVASHDIIIQTKATTTTNNKKTIKCFSFVCWPNSLQPSTNHANSIILSRALERYGDDALINDERQNSSVWRCECVNRESHMHRPYCILGTNRTVPAIDNGLQLFSFLLCQSSCHHYSHISLFNQSVTRFACDFIRGGAHALHW